VAREFGALGARPAFERDDQGEAPFFARDQVPGDRQTIDLALDVEQRIDRLQCDRRGASAS
jgi:hypothetical protein